MGGNFDDVFTGSAAEDADEAVVASEDYATVENVDRACVSFRIERTPDADLATSLQVPLTQRHIVAGRVDETVMAGDREHVLVMPFDHLANRSSRQIPHNDAAISRCGHACLAVSERETFDVVAMPAEHARRCEARGPRHKCRSRKTRRLQGATRIDGDMVAEVAVVTQQIDCLRRQVEHRDRAVIGRGDCCNPARDRRDRGHGPAMPREVRPAWQCGTIRIRGLL